MEKEKRLSKGTKIAIAVGAAVAVAGAVVGVMAINGAFLTENGAGGGGAGGNPSSGSGSSRSGYDPVITPDEKPIIYLYPEKETEVEVSLGYPEKITSSYPQYVAGWRVLAEPNGKLTDLNTNRELYSLYWEGNQGKFEITDKGFVVAGTEVAEFLEEKLAILGLSEREAEEFIIYWLPRLQDNKYNYVRFATAEEIEEYMPLTITPQPDTIIRVLMITRPLEGLVEVEEQDLGDTPQRNGFTVVEWGGSATE